MPPVRRYSIGVSVPGVGLAGPAEQATRAKSTIAGRLFLIIPSSTSSSSGPLEAVSPVVNLAGEWPTFMLQPGTASPGS